MQPPLSDCARNALEQAQAEARTLNQEFVGTEHLFLALLKSHGCLVSRVLNEQHVDRDAARSDLMMALPYSETPPVVTGNLPLSPRAQRAVNNAIVMSQSLREAKVTTRVLLLALLEEPNTPFSSVFRTAGVDVVALVKSLAAQPADQES